MEAEVVEVRLRGGEVYANGNESAAGGDERGTKPIRKASGNVNDNGTKCVWVRSLSVDTRSLTSSVTSIGFAVEC